jgi:Rhodopirellula transposase.
MFSFISMNWRGQPLVRYETVINLISATKTTKGLTVAVRLDKRDYARGIKIADKDMAHLRIQPHSLHPQWNYSLSPRDASTRAEN